MPAKRKKKQKEYEERINQAISILSKIAEDVTTPRNIRRAAKESINVLQSKDLSYGVRAANAVSILDEVSQDPNMPVYTRTAIWNAISIIEGIKD